jgi:type IV pilus assembly protein PilC
MEYSYVAYSQDRKVVKGRVSAASEEAAANLLNYGGYQVVSLKQYVPFVDKKLFATPLAVRVKPREIIMFSRQLALLLESGAHIVGSLELIQSQITNQAFKGIIGEVVSDIGRGSSFSSALAKHPRAFPEMYHQAVAAGEQGGNLEIVLRQMADYLERGVNTQKKIKSSLSYPIIVAVVALVSISILVVVVLPQFAGLFAAFGGELPLATRMLIGMTDWLRLYGFYIMLVTFLAAGAGWAYIKTRRGKYQWDKLLLSLPVVGRIFLLNELSRCCQTIALLFRVGLPLPKIMSLAINSSNNKAMAEALTEVQQELIKGEGLSQPMAKRKLFLPLMVQMVKVGEETGNLDKTLLTVAQSFEVECDDRTSAAVGLIQPALTIIIGLIVGFIALALVSAMFGIYGEIGR